MFLSHIWWNKSQNEKVKFMQILNHQLSEEKKTEKRGINKVGKSLKINFRWKVGEKMQGKITANENELSLSKKGG